MMPGANVGLFTSKCPECSKKIDWFLVPPDNFVCSCGRHVSMEEIEASWDEIYREHLKNLDNNHHDGNKGVEG